MSNSMSRAAIAAVLSLVVTAVVGVDPRPARAGGCLNLGCGTNSPVMTGTPIEALHLGVGHAPGTEIANQLGVVLLRGSLQSPLGSPCRKVNAVNLGVDADGNLEGLDGNDKPVCFHDDLLGSTFKVGVPGVPMRKVRAEDVPLTKAERKALVRHVVRIDGRNPVPVWKPSGTGQNYVFPMVAAYDLADVTDPVKPIELCPRLPPMEDYQIAVTNEKLLAQYPQWWAPSNSALFVRGESYQPDASLRNGDHQWFNIACFRSALAKARLLDIKPMGSPTTVEERVATLKMITARYHGLQSFTRPGNPVRWTRMVLVNGSYVQAIDGYAGDPVADGPIEAYWTSTGAACLGHLRRAIAVAGTVATTGKGAELPQVQKIQSTHSLGSCIDSATGSEVLAPVGANTVYWVTYTVKHAHQGNGYPSTAAPD